MYYCHDTCGLFLWFMLFVFVMIWWKRIFLTDLYSKFLFCTATPWWKEERSETHLTPPHSLCSSVVIFGWYQWYFLFLDCFVINLTVEFLNWILSYFYVGAFYSRQWCMEFSHCWGHMVVYYWSNPLYLNFGG